MFNSMERPAFNVSEFLLYTGLKALTKSTPSQQVLKIQKKKNEKKNCWCNNKNISRSSHTPKNEKGGKCEKPKKNEKYQEENI